MKRSWLGLALFALLALGTSPAQAGEIGEDAPALQPSKWLNVKGPINWQMLQGKLVLIEKWATW